MKWFLVVFTFMLLVVPVSHGASLEWDESPGAIGYKIYTSPTDGPDPLAQPAEGSNYVLWVTLYVEDAAPVELQVGEQVIQGMLFDIPEGTFSGTVYLRATAFNHTGESENEDGTLKFSNYAKGEFGAIEPPGNLKFFLPLP